MRFSSVCFICAAAAMACGITASKANATIEANLINGVTTVPLTGTNNAGGGSSLSSTNLTVGNFHILLFNATSNSGVVPTPALDQINATALTVTNTGSSAQTLTINLSDVGFAPPATGQPLNLSESGSVTFTIGSTGDSASLISYADPSNTQFNEVNPTPTSNISWTNNGTVLLPPRSATFSLGSSTAFSMTDVFMLTLNPGDDVNLSYTTATTPEPATLVMMVLGGAALLLKKSKKLKTK